MEVGIEDCLHIEFEYDKSKYHLKDTVVGKIYFLLARPRRSSCMHCICMPCVCRPCYNGLPAIAGTPCARIVCLNRRQTRGAAQVRIKLKHMEIEIRRRETTGAGSAARNESETLAKYEIMDGAPVRGENIPIRCAPARPHGAARRAQRACAGPLRRRHSCRRALPWALLAAARAAPTRLPPTLTPIPTGQAVPGAVRPDAHVQDGAQQVQRQVLPQPGAGRRGGPALLQAAGDRALPPARPAAGAAHAGRDAARRRARARAPRHAAVLALSAQGVAPGRARARARAPAWRCARASACCCGGAASSLRGRPRACRGRWPVLQQRHIACLHVP